MNRYYYFLAAVLFAVWIWAAINPVYPHDWLLENYLVFIFVPLVVLLGMYFRLSKISYTLITLFLILHIIGSHYTYAETPFGFILQDWFGTSRNIYDRLVHFSFGFLLFYPVREVFMRLARVKGFWSYYFPIDLVASFSVLYEIIEWLTARVVSPEAGLAFLGSQGDVWDAQKDMGLAILGSVLAALIIFGINAYIKKNFWREIKASFRVPKGDHELGEVELMRMVREKFKQKIRTRL